MILNFLKKTFYVLFLTCTLNLFASCISASETQPDYRYPKIPQIPFDGTGARAAVIVVPQLQNGTTVYSFPSFFNVAQSSWIWSPNMVQASQVPYTFSFGTDKSIEYLDIIPIGGDVQYWIDGQTDTVKNGFPRTITFYPHVKKSFKLGVTSLSPGTSVQIDAYGSVVLTQ